MPLRHQLDPDLAAEYDRLAQLPADARFARAESLLLRAQGSGSFAEEFVAREAVAQASYYVPDDPRHLVHFAWLRQAVERHPELDDQDRWHVLWMMKWAVSLAWGMPQVSLADVERMVDDLERLHVAHGYGVRPAMLGRAKLAAAGGDDAGAAAAVRGWLAAPRDGMSDCEACERHDQATLVAPTDLSWAIAHLQPVLAQEVTCDSQPLEATALAADLHERAGDHDAARDLAVEAWRSGRDRRDLPRTVASVLRTFTRLGSVDRALAGLLPRLAWLPDLEHDSDVLDFAATAAHVLDVAARRGLAPATLDGRPVGEVVDELRATARRLSEAFDARNGSSVEGDRLREVWDLDRVAESAPLPPLLVAEAPGGAAVQDERGISERAARLRQVLDDVSPDVEAEAMAWLRDRERVLAAETPDDASDVAFLDRITCRTLDEPEQRARLEGSLARAERAEDSAESRRARCALLRLDAAAGDDSRLEEVAAIAASLEADGELAHAAAEWRQLADDLPPPRSAELALRSAQCSGRHGDVVRQALALVDAARATMSADDRPGADRLLEQAEELAGDHPSARAAACALRWRLMATDGDVEGAIALLRQQVATSDGGRLEAGLRIDLCDLLVDTEDYESLAGESALLVGSAVELRDGTMLAMAQRFRGLAHVEAGEFVEGSELLEAAVPVIRERVPFLVGPAAWALGNALTGLGEWHGARTAFASAALGFEAEGRHHDTAHAQLRAGGAAWDAADLTAAQAHLERAVELAREHQVVWVFQQASRDHAAVTCALGDVAGGIEALDRVSGETHQLALRTGLEVTDEDEARLRRSILRQAAFLLAEAGDHDAALPRLQQAERESPDPEEVVLLRSDQGQVLAWQGRLDEAGSLLREALPQMGSEHWRRSRVQAAGQWATALDQAGRTDEADAVWSEFGPDA